MEKMTEKKQAVTEKKQEKKQAAPAKKPQFNYQNVSKKLAIAAEHFGEAIDETLDTLGTGAGLPVQARLRLLRYRKTLGAFKRKLVVLTSAQIGKIAAPAKQAIRQAAKHREASA
jgi:hypothetical protein